MTVNFSGIDTYQDNGANAVPTRTEVRGVHRFDTTCGTVGFGRAACLSLLCRLYLPQNVISCGLSPL